MDSARERNRFDIEEKNEFEENPDQKSRKRKTSKNEVSPSPESENSTHVTIGKEIANPPPADDQHRDKDENRHFSQTMRPSASQTLPSEKKNNVEPQPKRQDQNQEHDDRNSRFEVIRETTYDLIPLVVSACLFCLQWIFKKLTDENVEPRTLTKIKKIQIIALRLLMILHNIITIWRVTVEKNNPLYWILTLTIMLQVLEGVYSFRSDRRIRKRWRPCFVVYFASVIPSIWILQYEQHIKIVQGRQENSTCNEVDADGLLDAIQGLSCLKNSTWFVIVLETFAYILLIGRLLHDSLTHEVMIQQMLGFLASAADIMEFFTLFEDEKVAKDFKATFLVLLFWTISFLQFVPIWGSRKSGDTQREHTALSNDKKHYFSFCPCKRIGDILDDSKPPGYLVQIKVPGRTVINDINQVIRRRNLEEESTASDKPNNSTDRYETGFAYVFQDGPFLILRLYLMLKLNIFTQSMFFFTLKNITLSVLLLSKFKWTFCLFLKLSMQIAFVVIVVGTVT